MSVNQYNSKWTLNAVDMVFKIYLARQYLDHIGLDPIEWHYVIMNKQIRVYGINCPIKNKYSYFLFISNIVNVQQIFVLLLLYV